MAFKMKYANGNGFPFKSSPMDYIPPVKGQDPTVLPHEAAIAEIKEADTTKDEDKTTKDEDKAVVTKETKDEKTIVNPTLHEKITDEDVTKEMTKGALIGGATTVGKVLPTVLERKKKKKS
tara:strand:+ start:674 stop:1036 length:363 start_codon:yes stop_codon:yes gene_type:complete